MTYHRNLGISALVLLIGCALTVLVGVARRRPLPWLGTVAWVAEGVLGVQVVLGLVLLVAGHRPSAGLHLLYGGVVIVPLPAALLYASSDPRADRRALLVLVGLGAAGLLAVRAVLTG